MLVLMLILMLVFVLCLCFIFCAIYVIRSSDSTSNHCSGGPLTGVFPAPDPILSFSTIFFSLVALFTDVILMSGGEVEVELGVVVDEVKRDITASRLDGAGADLGAEEGAGAGVGCVGCAGLSE